jgi:hypothetical protein
MKEITIMMMIIIVMIMRLLLNVKRKRNIWNKFVLQKGVIAPFVGVQGDGSWPACTEPCSESDNCSLFPSNIFQ